MLTQGKTSGVFQMESAGMTGVCVGLKPQTIEDLTAIVALYRPGPMESIPRFITTPAAWVDAWRGMPSRDFAVSMSFFTRSSPSYISLSCLLI